MGIEQETQLQIFPAGEVLALEEYFKKGEVKKSCVFCGGRVYSLVDHYIETHQSPMVSRKPTRKKETGSKRNKLTYSCIYCGGRHHELPPHYRTAHCES